MESHARALNGHNSPLTLSRHESSRAHSNDNTLFVTPEWFGSNVQVEKRDLVSSGSSWLVRGAAAGAILTMPLGPVGFLAGGIVGGVLTVIFGLLADAVRFRKSRRQAEKQKGRLEQLLRWAVYTMVHADNPIPIFVYVVLEFQGVVLLENQNAFTQTSVKHFREFLELNEVQEYAMTAIENFFSRWRLAKTGEIAICHTMLQTCIATFARQKRKPPVYRRMEDLIKQSQVQRLFAGAADEQKEMRDTAIKRKDWLIFAELEVRPQDVFVQDFARRFLRRGSSFRQREAPPTTVPASSAADPSHDSRSLDTLSGESERRRATSLSRGATRPALVVEKASVPDISTTRARPGLIRKASPQIPTFGATGKAPHPFFDPTSWDPVNVADLRKQKALSFATEERRPSTDNISHAVTIGSLENRATLNIEDPRHEIKAQVSPSSIPISLIDSLSPPLLPLSTPQGPENDVISEVVSPPSPEAVPRKFVKPSILRRRTSKGFNRSQVPPCAPEAETRSKSIEERRVFRDFEDLVNFQPELKHKVPIGLYEFDFLDQFEPELTKDKTWDPVTIKPTTRIYKRIVSVRGSDLVMVKGYAHMADIPCHVVLWNIRDTPRRLSWDTTFEGFVLVERDVLENEVVYNSIRAPWPVANRDFLQWRRTVVDPISDVIKIMHRSAEHPGFPEPNGQSMVRAESIISAYIIRPTDNGKSCDLFLITQVDIKGLIPRWVVNNTAGKAPFGWIENLRRACYDSIKTFGNTPPAYNPRPLFENGMRVEV